MSTVNILTHLSICLVLSFMQINFSTDVYAYRVSGWPGSGQRAAYPQGDYHPYARGTCCSWALQTPPKFTPEPSANFPNGFTTLTNKLGTPPLQRNAVPRIECRDGNKVYSPGDKWTPSGGCGRLSCTTAGKTTVLGCPSPEPRSNCSISAPDPRQPWPFCCPKQECV